MKPESPAIYRERARECRLISSLLGGTKRTVLSLSDDYALLANIYDLLANTLETEGGKHERLLR